MIDLRGDILYETNNCFRWSLTLTLVNTEYLKYNQSQFNETSALINIGILLLLLHSGGR